MRLCEGCEFRSINFYAVFDHEGVHAFRRLEMILPILVEHFHRCRYWHTVGSFWQGQTVALKNISVNHTGLLRLRNISGICCTVNSKSIRVCGMWCVVWWNGSRALPSSCSSAPWFSSAPGQIYDKQQFIAADLKEMVENAWNWAQFRKNGGTFASFAIHSIIQYKTQISNYQISLKDNIILMMRIDFLLQTMQLLPQSLIFIKILRGILLCAV